MQSKENKTVNCHIHEQNSNREIVPIKCSHLAYTLECYKSHNSPKLCQFKMAVIMIKQMVSMISEHLQGNREGQMIERMHRSLL